MTGRYISKFIKKMRRVGAAQMAALALFALAGCGRDYYQPPSEPGVISVYEGDYAEHFKIIEYVGGYKEIRVSDGRSYLLIPSMEELGKKKLFGEENEESAFESVTQPWLPDEYEDYFKDSIKISVPIRNSYLAASAAMCRFESLEAMDRIAFSATKSEDWEIEEARKAMESGDIIYAGKYSEPDYEMLLSGGCGLAIENAMILHKPENIDKLEELGIPVFIDLSSMEEEPLGRTEWIVAYGALTCRMEEAIKIFEEQKALAENLPRTPSKGCKVAYFYVNSQGQIVCQKADSAMAKMIKYAGGEYAGEELLSEDGSLVSTVKTDMETFMSIAKDADFLIYDATINPISSAAQLVALNPLFEEFTAVQNGSLYIAGTSMYQNSDKAGSLMADLNAMLSGSDEMKYIRRAD